MDRRVLKTYMDQFFSQEAVSPDPFPLSKSGTYYIPEDTDLQGYKNYIQHVLPTQDDSEAFGQHPNADISSQVEETNVLLDTILSLQVGDPTKPPSIRLPRPHPSARNQPGARRALQPSIVSVGGETTEDKVLRLADELAATVPEDLPLHETIKAKEDDPSALNVVLIQVSACARPKRCVPRDACVGPRGSGRSRHVGDTARLCSTPQHVATCNNPPGNRAVQRAAEDDPALAVRREERHQGARRHVVRPRGQPGAPAGTALHCAVPTRPPVCRGVCMWMRLRLRAR
jgi:hypothetical protein